MYIFKKVVRVLAFLCSLLANRTGEPGAAERAQPGIAAVCAVAERRSIGADSPTATTPQRRRRGCLMIINLLKVGSDSCREEVGSRN
jgi:hypothetical protein